MRTISTLDQKEERGREGEKDMNLASPKDHWSKYVFPMKAPLMAPFSRALCRNKSKIKIKKIEKSEKSENFKKELKIREIE
jgi:hypothetical protein